MLAIMVRLARKMSPLFSLVLYVRVFFPCVVIKSLWRYGGMFMGLPVKEGVGRYVKKMCKYFPKRWKCLRNFLMCCVTYVIGINQSNITFI